MRKVDSELRRKFGLLAISFVALLLFSTAQASLSVSVNVEAPEIEQFESQVLKVTTNEGGVGVLLVLQPAEGTPWMDFLEDYRSLMMLWYMLPNHTRTRIADRIGQKIVSFSMIRTEIGGGEVTVTFPENFTGVNGEPSTAILGEYKAILAFLSSQKENSEDSCCASLKLTLIVSTGRLSRYFHQVH